MTMSSQKNVPKPEYGLEKPPHLTARAELQVPASHAPPLQTNARTPGGRLRRERYLCARPALREEDADPRAREVTPGDEDDVLHAVDPQAEIVGDLHAVVDVADEPFTEIATGDRILAFCREREG